MTVGEMVQAEQELGVELEKYSDRWVAIRDYAVVADAPTLGELLEQIAPQDEEVEVRHIPADQAAVCFF